MHAHSCSTAQAHQQRRSVQNTCRVAMTMSLGSAFLQDTQLGNVEKKKLPIRPQHKSLDTCLAEAPHKAEVRISYRAGETLEVTVVCDS